MPLLMGLSAALMIPALMNPAGCQAETRYVTDQLEIVLKAGENPRSKTLKVLPTGTPLEVLGVNPNTRYARVKAGDGTVGFVPEGQLQAEPAARNRVPELERRLAELEQDPDSLSSQLTKVQSEHSDLVARYQGLERDKQRLEQELATIRYASANVLDLTNDRERLRLQVAELTRVSADLEQENGDLKHQENQRWFLIGAGVLIGGMLLGLLLPRLRLGRRKTSWETL
jgi:SH3 domain protein